MGSNLHVPSLEMNCEDCQCVWNNHRYFSEQREAVKPIERSEKGLTKGVGSGRTRSPFRVRVRSQRRQRGGAGVVSSTFGFYIDLWFLWHVFHPPSKNESNETGTHLANGEWHHENVTSWKRDNLQKRNGSSGLQGITHNHLYFSEQREAVKPIERSEKGLTKGVGSGRTRSPFRVRVRSRRRHRGDAGVASSTSGFYIDLWFLWQVYHPS
jgi:hypothetical protein